MNEKLKRIDSKIKEIEEIQKKISLLEKKAKQYNNLIELRTKTTLSRELNERNHLMFAKILGKYSKRQLELSQESLELVKKAMDLKIEIDKEV